MSTEELLKPRAKCIGNGIYHYPGSHIKPGDVIHCDGVMTGWFREEMPKYPHLFQPLPWWAERSIEDMPEYVKYQDRVFRVEWSDHLGSWHPKYTKDSNRTDQQLALAWHYKQNEVLPATLAEYTEYLNTKQ